MGRPCLYSLDVVRGHNQGRYSRANKLHLSSDDGASWAPHRLPARLVLAETVDLPSSRSSLKRSAPTSEAPCRYYFVVVYEAGVEGEDGPFRNEHAPVLSNSRVVQPVQQRHEPGSERLL